VAAAALDGTGLPLDSDAALAARAGRGDRRAFERLYGRWAARVERFAASRLGSHEDAEDVAQEVFLALHRGLARYEGRSSFGTWLFGIAYHLVCRRLRQRARAAFAPLEAVERTPAPLPGAEARVDAARALERCAAILVSDTSRGQRHAVELCIGGLADAAVSSPEARRAQLLRARRRLRERVPGLEDALG
jgi:RNA polymerase sigma-70 factor (ECF subfamily)